MLIRKYLITFVLALVPLLGFADEQSSWDVKYDLKNCLTDCYHTDHKSTDIIIGKFNPLIEHVSTHYVINEFIEKSKGLNIDFTANKSIELLPPDDAILQAPDWHEILFESSHVRIFWGFSKPGDREPFHRHQWKRIMVMLQDATFKIENADGSIEVGTWPMGVYELPPDITPSAYTNIGNTEFIALIFEVKV